MAPCRCSILPAYIERNDFPGLFDDMEEVAYGYVPRILKKCPTCGQLWSVDEPDKYAAALCIKVDSPVDWEEAIKPAMKERLVKRYGGFSDEKCAWENCQNRAMKKLAYCPDCATAHMHIWD